MPIEPILFSAQTAERNTQPCSASSLASQADDERQQLTRSLFPLSAYSLPYLMRGSSRASAMSANSMATATVAETTRRIAMTRFVSCN